MGFGIMADAFGKVGEYKEKAENIAKQQKQQKQRDNTKLNSDNRLKKTTGSYVNNQQEVATAPYNFIPLPGSAVVSPLGKVLGKNVECWADNYAQFVSEQGKCSGYVDVTLTAQTPVCINCDGKFFAPNGFPVIPGSSLRGMVKNYLKIISCGTMRAGSDGVSEDFTDRHLYYRDIAGNGILSANYRRELFYIKDGHANSGESHAGFLARLENGQYVIFPAKFDPVEYENPWRDMERYANQIVAEKDYVDLHTGVMNGKKHYYRLYLENNEWPKPLTDTKDAIDDYINDKERGTTEGRSSLNLLDAEKNQSETEFASTCPEKLQHLVPCFYLANENKVIHFGYCKFYRIPYKKSIKGHVPEGLQDEKIVDFADAIFGKKDDFAGRVFFENLLSTGIKDRNMNSQNYVLASPKPTSFQLYLEQNGKSRNNGKDRYHWDSPANVNIRGYKLYWHNENIAKGVDKANITTELTPVDKGTVFAGRIRFEHLSEIELGALLRVLKLGENGCFKIGAGKALGFGSVRSNSTLYLIDENVCYSSLFAGDGWQLGEKKSEMDRYIKEFDCYMKKNISDLEKYEMIKELLKIMMNWEHKPDSNRIQYMNLDDFRQRNLLERPDEVVGMMLKKKKK